MSTYLYAIFGIIATLLGWTISQIILTFARLIGKTVIFNPDFILFPIIAGFLTTAMVAAQIFLNAPTHPKKSWRAFRRSYFWVALGIGTFLGFIPSLITQLLYKSGWSPEIVNILAWCLIGLVTGFTEGGVWNLRKGATSKAKQRHKKVILYGGIAGFCAAILSMIITGLLPPPLQRYEDPLGFGILGLVLGVFISKATAPNYRYALRAGHGFPVVLQQRNLTVNDAVLNNSRLKFVIKDESRRFNFIEEGLSIELPSDTAQSLTIGGNDQSHIRIPYIADKCAELNVKEQGVTLKCLNPNSVAINFSHKPMDDQGEVELRHNSIITFYHKDYEETANDDEKEKKIYRFVFYDRLLDPDA